MRDVEELFAALQRSSFRSQQTLSPKDRAYLQDRGLEAVLLHATDFVTKRLAPAAPANDGKQTPWRGHPVFTAQHATATCCRGCLAKWHRIEQGRPLREDEQRYVVDVLARWLGQYVDANPADGQARPGMTE
jgi:hypothetical protein